MKRWRGSWSEALAPLKEAGMDLLRAEYGVVSSEMRLAGRQFLKALLLLLVGLFTLFWAVGATALVIVEVLSLWLPRWGAALVLLGSFLLTAWLLAEVARRRLRSIERPAQTLRRRFDEHRDWWDRKISTLGPDSGARTRPTQLESDDAGSDGDAAGP